MRRFDSHLSHDQNCLQEDSIVPGPQLLPRLWSCNRGPGFLFLKGVANLFFKGVAIVLFY